MATKKPAAKKAASKAGFGAPKQYKGGNPKPAAKKAASSNKNKASAASKYAGFHAPKQFTSGGAKAPAAKPNQSPFPSIEEYLAGDLYYNTILSDLQRNLEQFNIQNGAAQGDINSLFGITMDRMNKEKGRATTDIKDDFGARGIINSGLFGKSISDYNDDFSDKVEDLNRDRSMQLRNLGFESSNFQSLTDTQENQAKLDAIRRRAEELGTRNAVTAPAKSVAPKPVAKPAAKKTTASPLAKYSGFRAPTIKKKK